MSRVRLRSMLALAIFENVSSQMTIASVERKLPKKVLLNYGIRKDTRITKQDWNRSISFALELRRKGSTAISLLRQVRDRQPCIRRDTVFRIIADH